MHELYGGVVPEMASRAHIQNIVPVVDVALKKSGLTLDDLSAIAFTQSPGLLGSLLVGGCFAKSLAKVGAKSCRYLSFEKCHFLTALVHVPSAQEFDRILGLSLALSQSAQALA
jgi:N6-L-threonylcarbamoyladenine synthase